MLTKLYSCFRYNCLQSPAADCNLHALVLPSDALWLSVVANSVFYSRVGSGLIWLLKCGSRSSWPPLCTVQVISPNEHLVIRYTRGGQTVHCGLFCSLCKYYFRVREINSSSFDSILWITLTLRRRSLPGENNRRRLTDGNLKYFNVE